MASTIPIEISNKISNKIDRVLWLEESVENLTYVVQKLSNQIEKLESNQPQSKVSPVKQRAEILRDKALNSEKDPINSRRAMQILGVNSRMQAIRAMKKAAEIFDDLMLHQHPVKLKSYSLLVKATAGEPVNKP